MAGTAAAIYGALGTKRAWGFNQSSGLRLTLFSQQLRGVGPGGIPVALPDGISPVTGAAHYSFNIGDFHDTLHPNLGPTSLWGYSPSVALGEGGYPKRHLGGIVVANKDVPIQMTFTNTLPNQHILPVDVSAFFPDAASSKNKTSTHLHGGFVPWISDGGPFSWFDPQGNYGPSVPLSFYELLNPAIQAGQAEYYYPNQQSARMLWYHDHAHETTRLNAYAGIASAYLIRDGFEGSLRNQGLPDFVENGGYELPIIVQDKVFVNGNPLSPNYIFDVDPTWPNYCPSTTGSLWYAHVYDPADLGSNPIFPLPDPSSVPEFFGDTMLANGTVYPEVEVEARRYRFRVLNACSSRFLNLQMYIDDGSPNGITLDKRGKPQNKAALNAAAANPHGAPTSNFLVLGAEGGFLPRPAFVASNTPFNGTATGGSLLLAPAERVDMLFDFSKHVGQQIILYTDAPAPFPDGDAGTDFFPGWNVRNNPVNGITTAGEGPNTRVIMRFKVVPATSVDPLLNISHATDLTLGNDALLVPPGVTTPPPGVPVRQLTLNEEFDDWGRLIQRIGTNVPLYPGTFARFYMDTPTETPTAGSTEVWEFANLTGDTHPIHFHLVNVQIISRQPFKLNTYDGTPNLTGAPVPPPMFERGWKETVRMNPGEVTTVIMKFALPSVSFAVPPSPRLQNEYGITGAEYVYHCHILEHEEHDMMRPLVVL
jgi:spore coat protein A